MRWRRRTSSGPTSGASDEEETSVAAFQAQAGALEDRLRGLKDQITAQVDALAAVSALEPGGADAARISAGLTGLRSQAASVAQELAEVNGRAADARLGADLHRRGTRVVEVAEPPARPSSPRPARDAAVGGIAGLIIGVAVALVLGRIAPPATGGPDRIAGPAPAAAAGEPVTPIRARRRDHLETSPAKTNWWGCQCCWLRCAGAGAWRPWAPSPGCWPGWRSRPCTRCPSPARPR